MNVKPEMKIGVAELELRVPLFAELYGYGPFLGRRNRGERDPLFCRALCFSEGNQTLMLIVCDLVVTDDELARSARARIARELGIAPEGILIAGTHTHSGPAVSLGIGWGEICPEFIAHWRGQIVAAAEAAFADLEPVTVRAGKAFLSQPLGYNRVCENGPTDPEIRWLKILRSDGSVKSLLHNHGMHGVVFGSKMLKVSADWMGEANRLIKERKLAETPFFLYAPAGNINTRPCCLDQEKGEPELLRIGTAYVDDLEKSLRDPGRELNLYPLAAKLETTELPCQKHSAAELRGIAQRLDHHYLVDRLEEMAILVEDGYDQKVAPDLQVLRLADMYIYAFPGEPFVELGQELARHSPGSFPLSAAVANGNCRYFPTAETFARFPDGFLTEKGTRGYGYYEIHQGSGRYMPPYQPDIASFLIARFLQMAQEL